MKHTALRINKNKTVIETIKESAYTENIQIIAPTWVQDVMQLSPMPETAVIPIIPISHNVWKKRPLPKQAQPTSCFSPTIEKEK